MSIITYAVGDLLDSDEPVIAHGANCRGAMGAGIAGQIAVRWPHVRAEYQVACRHGYFRVGSALLITTKDQPHIFNLGTQRKPGPDATRWAIFLSFANMAEVCMARNIDRVAIPRIGCGIGGLDWMRVQVEIEEALNRSTHPNLTIAVYDLPVKR